MINTSTNTITINNGFRLSSTPAVGTKFSFEIPGIRNPISLKTTTSFNITTADSSGDIIDEVSSGITVTMNQSAYMESVIITLGSYVNANTTSYEFQITPTVPVTSDDYVVIQFPPEIVIPTSLYNLDCSTQDYEIFNYISCSFNTAMLSNSIKIALSIIGGQINILQTFRLTV